MEIAIFLSTYNGSRYLKKQLDSIANQTYIDLIHLYVRDDGSTDSTLDIISQYSCKINITVILGDNVGPARSFWELFTNKDIMADYYAFCDQDDIWDKDKVEKGVKALNDSIGLPMLWCSNCRLIDANDNIIADEMNHRKPAFTIVSQLVCGTTQGCAMLFNHSLRKYVMEKNIKDFPMHDYVVMMYAIAAGKIIYDEVPSFSYRIHSNNVVANSGKTTWDRIKKVKSSWFSQEHKREISKFANIIYKDNLEKLDKTTIQYINNLQKCRTNIWARWKIIFDKKTVTDNKRAERSFKVKTLLGII